MHEAGVAIVPGTAFGKPSIDFVRFSFAASRDNIQKHLENWKMLTNSHFDIITIKDKLYSDTITNAKS